MKVSRWKYCKIPAFLLITGIVGHSTAHAEYYREAPGNWTIAEADSETCGLINYFEFQGTRTTLYIQKEIAGTSYLSVSNPNWTVVKGRDYKIRYELNGQAYGGSSTALDNGGFAIEISEDFERDFIAAASLYMTLDDKVIDHLSLKGSGLALKYLNDCVSIIKRKHDALEREKAKFSYIDANPFAEAKPLPLPAGRAPKPMSNSWASTNDYPSLALMRELEGVTTFKVKVGVNGRVMECEVIKSSGHSELDDVTCPNVTRRAKFEPATDAEGTPVEGFFEGSVNWKIPR